MKYLMIRDIHGRSRSIRPSRQDLVFDSVINIILLLITFLCIYPLYFVVISSVSDPDAVNAGKVLFYPVGVNSRLQLNFAGYARAFKETKIWRGYMNTLLYTGCGTLVGTFSTLLAGYALSREDLVGRKALTGIYVFTMYFGGGLVPTYTVIKNLGLLNSRLLMILFSSVSVYNVIIARSFYQSTIAKELREAAFVDGASNGRFFFSIVVPISKAITAVLALYYAVGFWNSYFYASIFLTSDSLYPLQLVLRDILVASQSMATDLSDIESIGEAQRIAELLKYVVIILSSLPVLILYPFLQRYFVKGVMIGSLKG